MLSIRFAQHFDSVISFILLTRRGRKWAGVLGSLQLHDEETKDAGGPETPPVEDHWGLSQETISNWELVG